MMLSMRVLHPARLLVAPPGRRAVTLGELRALERAVTSAPAWRRLRTAAAAARSEAPGGDASGARKFLDVDLWLRATVLRAAQLGLHRAAPRRILDLGCGTGLFVHVCRTWGHDAEGLDLPASRMRDSDRAVYDLVAAHLGVPVHRAVIDDPAAVALPGTFDLITAFKVCFNRHRGDGEWGAGEWSAFLSSACAHLTEPGAVHLALNPHAERYGRLLYYDEPTRALLERCGGRPRRGVATVPRAGAVRAVADASRPRCSSRPEPPLITPDPPAR